YHGRRRRRSDIEFQVSTHANSIAVCADFDEAALIFLCLREKEVNVFQNARKPTAHAKISGKRAIGNARVDDSDVGSLSFRSMEKVRPEFSFRQDDELRTQRAQVGLDGETKVEREVED